MPSQSRCSPPPHLTTCGITTNWPKSGTTHRAQILQNGLQREPGRNHRTLTRLSDVPRTRTQRTRPPRSSRFLPTRRRRKNLDWLFPTISNREHIFTKFRVLSLTIEPTASSQCWRQSATTSVPNTQNQPHSSVQPRITTSPGWRLMLTLAAGVRGSTVDQVRGRER
jgi:hypothetical protein